MILSEQEVTEIQNHFTNMTYRDNVAELKIISMSYTESGIKIIIVMRGERPHNEYKIIPPKGFHLTEVTIINLIKQRLEIHIKKIK